MDKVGIVTITYNSERVLKPFLSCIWKQTYNNFLLYVVDNSSSDLTKEILEEQQDTRLVTIYNSKNLGVAKANNQGIKRALLDGCNQILIINNDVEFESALIRKLLDFQEERKCSLVAPKIMLHDNPSHLWYAGGWFIKNKGYLPSHRGMKELDNGQYDEPREVYYAPTCCLLVKKEVFQEIGFMDEKYFVYFDDTDFCYRIYNDGRHKMMYFPQIKFYHKVGSLTKSFKNSDKNFFRGNFFIQQNVRNHIYFLKKIGGIFSFIFILWLFFKNNIRFFISPRIQKDFSTWLLINKSYFEGIKL